jgi:hypothetical protein
VRLLLGALILVALFLTATTWQRRFSEAARAERDASLGLPTPHEVEAPAQGWSVVTVGRPGGGEPYGASAAPRPSAPAPAANPATAPSGSSSQPSPVAQPSTVQGTTVWTVEAGQSLSRICSTRYGTARAEVVDAVARHNGLASPDLVREGQRLDLPPIDQILVKR